MVTMLRPFARGGGPAAFMNKLSGRTSSLRSTGRLMATQSGDDAAPPTALAKLHLEDGTTLTGRSFGCHESQTGEVRRCCSIYDFFME